MAAMKKNEFESNYKLIHDIQEERGKIYRIRELIRNSEFEELKESLESSSISLESKDDVGKPLSDYLLKIFAIWTSLNDLPTLEEIKSAIPKSIFLKILNSKEESGMTIIEHTSKKDDLSYSEVMFWLLSQEGVELPSTLQFTPAYIDKLSSHCLAEVKLIGDLYKKIAYLDAILKKENAIGQVLSTPKISSTESVRSSLSLFLDVPEESGFMKLQRVRQSLHDSVEFKKR